ncbi:MAG: GTPase ObgE, partial [Candidatus Zixiibacteriota bacterium]
GPNGGDGGRGGDIIFRSDSNLTTLMDFRYKRKYQAGNGRAGEGSLKTGSSGESIIVRIPTGTIITDLDAGCVLADLDIDGREMVVARGGRGGRGNTHFKSPTNQTPRRAEAGRPGEARKLALELKLLADVGLVGLPNAGKSTMLSVLSEARPKIADYPFTTLIPNLGIVRIREHRSFVMADIPGIIKGASAGKGLGLEFLRHIQRTRLIVYLIDIFAGEIKKSLATLENELARFDPALTERPSLVVLNKIDLYGENERKMISKKINPDYILFSALTGEGAGELLKRIDDTLERERKKRKTD